MVEMKKKYKRKISLKMTGQEVSFSKSYEVIKKEVYQIIRALLDSIYEY